MIYSEEQYSDITEELDVILPEFFKEVDIYPEAPEPDINHELLSSIDPLTITARVNSKLVGFHISVIENDIFYKTIKTAAVLFYYMLPEARGSGSGTKMFEYADKSFKDKEVKRIFMSRKIYINNEKMFDSLGYTHIESNYTKAI